MIVGGLLALGAGGAIAYKVATAKPAVAASSVVVDPNGWLPVTPGTSLPAGTQFAIAINNPPAAIVTFFTQFMQPAAVAASNVTAMHLYPVGATPPAGWPIADKYGATAFRVLATMKTAGTPLTIPAGITVSMWRK